MGKCFVRGPHADSEHAPGLCPDRPNDVNRLQHLRFRMELRICAYTRILRSPHTCHVFSPRRPEKRRSSGSLYRRLFVGGQAQTVLQVMTLESFIKHGMTAHHELAAAFWPLIRWLVPHPSRLRDICTGHYRTPTDRRWIFLVQSLMRTCRPTQVAVLEMSRPRWTWNAPRRVGTLGGRTT